MQRATVAPTFPAPPTTVTLRFMKSCSCHNDNAEAAKNADPKWFSATSALSALIVVIVYMLSMMASPNCDVFSSVAPAIRRAKS